MENVIFGKIVGRISKELKMSYYDLSQKTGIPQGEIIKIIECQGDVTKEKRTKILSVLKNAQNPQQNNARMRIVDGRIVCLSTDCETKKCKHIRQCMKVQAKISKAVHFVESNLGPQRQVI